MGLGWYNFSGSFREVYELPPQKHAASERVGGLHRNSNRYGARLVISPEIMNIHTTTSSNQPGQVLKGMALAGSFPVVHQRSAPKLTMLGIVGGLNCKWNSHG